MSVNIPGITEATGRNLVTELEKIAAILAAGTKYDLGSWQKLKAMVQSGIAQYALPVGTQISDTWTDKATNTVYNILWDIVNYQQVTLASGDIVQAVIMQWHYASPFGVPFDNFEAMYCADSAILPAGTYNFNIPTTWSNAVAGTYQFTLTQDLPAGGQISGPELIADKDPSTWTVKTWASNAATAPTETVTVTSGSAGTALGDLVPAGNDKLNSIQRIGYGYNRWSMSALRQFLNSSKAAKEWWTAQHKYDRCPNELLTKQGFLTGFSDDFLSVLTPIKITTALNTVTDTAVGTTEDTYDKIFLASLQNEFITPQLADVEGPIWDYWKRASGRSSCEPWSTPTPEYITYAVENHASAQLVRLRSAFRGSGNLAWYVSSTGNVDGTYAYGAFRFAPACAIC